MYILNDDIQNNPFCSLWLVVNTFGYSTNYHSIKVPRVVKPTSKLPIVNSDPEFSWYGLFNFYTLKQESIYYYMDVAPDFFSLILVINMLCYPCTHIILVHYCIHREGGDIWTVNFISTQSFWSTEGIPFVVIYHHCLIP